MRAQEGRPARRDAHHVRPPKAARPSASHAGAPLPPITALQRTAGNSAVVQMLAHQQDDLARASTDVQRSTAHSVLRSAGSPLHDSAADRSAAAIGARAYTSGEHVVTGRQGRDNHALAHEPTHVIQQRWGPVSGETDATGLNIGDPSDRFERAAETNATMTLQREPPTAEPLTPDEDAAAVQRPAGVPCPATTTPGNGVAPVQRFVSVNMGTEIFTDAPAPNSTIAPQTADDLMQKVGEAIEASNDRELIEQFHANYEKVFRQAKNWVADSQVGSWSSAGSQKLSTHKFGRKKQKRTYRTFEEAGRALVGWVLQKPGRHEEKEFANQLVEDPDLAADLDAVLTKVRGWITNLGADPTKLYDSLKTVDHNRIYAELASGTGTLGNAPKAFGRYQEHFDNPNAPRSHPTTFKGDFLAVLDHPDQFPVRDKIIVLHDLTDYFKPRNPSRNEPDTAGRDVLPDTPGTQFLASTQEMNPDGTRKEPGPDRGSKTTVRDEKAPSTRMARKHHIPVTAGQSFTAARLLSLGTQAGATPAELNAVALAIFALWRIDYDHTTDLAAHTLHEVLDIASNFGLAYNMKAPQRGSNTYPQVVAKRAKRTNDKLRSQLQPLGKAVEDMKQDITCRFLGSYRQIGRRRMADTLLRDYTTALDQSDARRTALEAGGANTPPQMVEQLKTDYYAALKHTLEIYEQICDLVKAKRIEDRLTENDRDAVGASRIP
jgi:hypothetical protein